MQFKDVQIFYILVARIISKIVFCDLLEGILPLKKS